MMTSVVFIGILLLTLLIAVFSRSGKDVMNVEEYLVGGRSFSGMILFFLAVGEVYSIGTMIGFPGGIYAMGPSYGIWFLAYILLAYPVGYYIAPLIWRAGKKYGAMTLPDIFKGHYSHRGLELIITLAFLIFLIPWAQLQFQGLIVALSALGFNLSPTVAVLISGAIAYIYISVSGVKAPALISIVKDILMFGAIVVVGIVVIVKVGSVSDLFTLVKAKGASVTIDQPKDIVYTVTTSFVQAIAFNFALIVAAVMTAKSEATVKKTQRFMPLYMLMYPFLVVTAYYALVAIPNLEQPNNAFIASSLALLPSWLVGLVAAGAALSGILVLSVISLSLGGVVSRNLVRNIPERSQRKWVQIFVLVYLLISMFITIYVPQLMLNIIEMAYYGFAQFVPGLLSVFFFRKVTPRGIISGVVAGTATAVLMHFNHINVFGINIGLISLIVNFIVTYAVSIVFKGSFQLVTPIAGRRSKNEKIISVNVSNNVALIQPDESKQS